MALYADAQTVVSVSVDSTVCVGDTVYVNVGYRNSNNVVVVNSQGTLSHPGCIFLPDGVRCNGECYYHTSVNFAGFSNSATIRSAEDIKYVRLNIEHSFIGDLYIALECPNGQRVALMKSQVEGNYSECGDIIPENHKSWDQTYPTAGPGASIGIPYDASSNLDACDSTLASNAPGYGWNYCWSNNTGLGYTYAEYDGLIYRRCNTHTENNPFDNGNYTTIDSSDIANGQHIYHPEIHFDSLAGCPINGAWTIYVVDAWTIDNGYIFDWEMAISDELLNSNVTLDSARVAGGMVINDSAFAVTLPQDFDGDTTITYTVTSYFSNGVNVDTTFTVHYMQTYHTEIYDTLCNGDTALFDGLIFTSSVDFPMHYTSTNGCDSIVDLHYRFMPNYTTVDTFYFCRNEQFIYDGVNYGGPADITSLYTTQYGCDSVVGVRLEMVDSLFFLRLLVSDDSITWSDDTAFHACRPFTLYLRDTTMLEQWRQWTFGDGDTLTETITSRNTTPISHTYDTIGSFTLTLSATSIRGCIDTSVVMTAAVNVYEAPKASFTWDPYPTNVLQANMQFINLSQPFDSLTYVWDIDGDSSTLPAPYYHWGAPLAQNPDAAAEDISGDHTVSLTAIWCHPLPDGDTLRCIDTTSRTVTIPDIYLHFPNLVSPNGDGTNDRWEVVNLVESGIFGTNELWIYNSWGVEIYHARNITKHADFWDPQVTSSPDGTYYYRFAATCPFGSLRRNGAIEVIRQ